jgi:hypothetical protein
MRPSIHPGSPELGIDVSGAGRETMAFIEPNQMTMLKQLVLTALILAGIPWPAVAGPAHKTENVFLITIDGLRWQEVFRGAEEALMTKE